MVLYEKMIPLWYQFCYHDSSKSIPFQMVQEVNWARYDLKSILAQAMNWYNFDLFNDFSSI